MASATLTHGLAINFHILCCSSRAEAPGPNSARANWGWPFDLGGYKAFTFSLNEVFEYRILF